MQLLSEEGEKTGVTVEKCCQSAKDRWSGNLLMGAILPEVPGSDRKIRGGCTTLTERMMEQHWCRGKRPNPVHLAAVVTTLLSVLTLENFVCSRASFPLLITIDLCFPNSSLLSLFPCILAGFCSYCPLCFCLIPLCVCQLSVCP